MGVAEPLRRVEVMGRGPLLAQAAAHLDLLAAPIPRHSPRRREQRSGNSSIATTGRGDERGDTRQRDSLRQARDAMYGDQTAVRDENPVRRMFSV